LAADVVGDASRRGADESLAANRSVAARAGYSPRPTIDVAAFSSWLAARAINQQSKKLDVLEGREPAPPLSGR
jgi:hypothetical protein